MISIFCFSSFFSHFSFHNLWSDNIFSSSYDYIFESVDDDAWCLLHTIAIIHYASCAYLTEVLLLKRRERLRKSFSQTWAYVQFEWESDPLLIARLHPSAYARPINRSKQHTMCTLIWARRKVLNFVSTSNGILSCCHFNSIIIIDCIFIIMFVFDIY